MKKLLPVIIVFLALSGFSQEPVVLTNESVIEMSKAGLPASVIISKIKTSSVKFDTELPALKALTESSVHESVVSAMIEISASKQSEIKAAVAEAEKKAAEPRAVSPNFTPYNQLDKTSQRQRIKAPAKIEIAAPASKLSPLLIRAFQTWDYQIESESERTLLLSKPVSGMGNKILLGMAMGGNNMRYKVQVSIGEYEGISSVIVSAWVTSDNAFGKTTQESLDRNKKWRPQLDELLLAVKRRAETDNQ